MSVKKFRQPEVKKKEFTFSSALELMKEKKSVAVCERVLKNMDRVQRAGVLSDMLLDSKYRAFNQVVYKFKKIIDEYKEYGNIERLKGYMSNLQGRTGEPLLDKLITIRECIIDDIINYKPELIIMALHNIVDSEEQFWYGQDKDDAIVSEMDKLYKPVAVNLCQIVWPDEAKGLKVLFGEKE